MQNVNNCLKPGRVCSFCVMDSSFPELRFDVSGQCDACKRALALKDRVWIRGAEGKVRLERMVDILKTQGKRKPYDAIVGLSGGIDSAYLAHFAVRELGLRILAVHVDAGWNSVQAVRNIGRIVRALDLDLYTYVVEWSDIRDLQLSFLKAHVINQDIPQDHAFFSTLYRVGQKFRIDYFLSGVNFATENTAPRGYGPSYMDARHIHAIHSRFGTKPFQAFSPMSLSEYLWLTRISKRPKQVKPLNLMDYDKEVARQILKREYGWEDYGPKHSESRWTKFYQEIYLPRKFGIDKRRIHLSSMIVAGSLTREEALKMLDKPMLTPQEERQQMKFVAKKLAISLDELENLIDAPGVDHQSYPNNKWLFEALVGFKRLLERAVLPR